MSDKFYIKIHRAYRNVVAVCDSDILGKTFEEGKMQLEVRESFYKGEERTTEEAIEILKSEKMNDSTFNIAGKKSVMLAGEAGIINKGNVGKVQGIPFALVLI
ncbi:DUF424 family protein [Candidatus Pacearchaeota archaeon]|nr:DUF424 family protein [Candidatus Pacearchaeota archaeon]